MGPHEDLDILITWKGASGHIYGQAAFGSGTDAMNYIRHELEHAEPEQALDYRIVIGLHSAGPLDFLTRKHFIEWVNRARHGGLDE